MFNFVRNNTKLLQFLLLVLIVPAFVLTGVYQGYSAFTDRATDVATVDGQRVTQTEWDAAHRDQVERIRRQMPNVDGKLFDSPEFRLQSLESLVRERVMLTAADKLHLGTSIERLQRELLAIPQLAAIMRPDGSIDLETYKTLLQAQGMSPAMFEARLRQDLTSRQVMLGIGGSTIAPAGAAAAALDALFQQREVKVQRFDAKDYLSKVNPTPADLETYYKDPAHAAQFQAPEQASVEYVVLDLEALKKGIAVTDEDLRKYYSENEKRYIAPEERRASHILVKADKDASPAERAKAKAKAEALLVELKKNPGSFAEVARKNSDDPGSAAKGGDLDFFGRGAMVKPFEDAAFALKAGELSGLVESDFGYHIIQLAAARGGERRGFDSVRAEIEDEVKKQLAQRRFSEAAVEFTNMVYEQADSLKPAADKFKLELRTAQGVTRAPGASVTGAMANAKLLEALFSAEATRNKRNTEAIEVGPNQIASARIVQYSAAHQLPFAEVSARVRDHVMQLQAAAQARKDGEARLAQVRSAPDTALIDAPRTVSRAQAGELPRAIVDAALKAPDGKLPAIEGVDLGEQGYAVLKVTKVLGRDPAAGDTAQAQAQYGQAWADAEMQAYYAALKTRLKVQIKPAAAASSLSAGS
jgi:peptidyl-prolyl cis-trans isomerase D